MALDESKKRPKVQPAERQPAPETVTREEFRVATESELEAVVQDLKRRNPKALLLFRGQTNLYPTIRSGRARPGASVEEAAEIVWNSLADFILDQPHSGDPEAAKALLQHYGLPTHFVDLTADVQTAAWFATHKYETSQRMYAGSSLRVYTTANYTPLDVGTGYVLVLRFPDPESLKAARQLFDLSILPEACARPLAQSGWLLYDHPPVRPQPSEFWIATIELDRTGFKSARNVAQLFPPPHRDKAYGRLLAAPFIQIPDHHNKSLLASSRAVDVPEYGADEDEIGRHKWCDFTIYEPQPMRVWQGWHFKLSTIHAGIEGDIASSTKIILAPGAAEVLRAAADAGCRTRWPSLDTNNLFFTFAAADHDKVIEHGPPYDGVWLYRDHDLIIEHPMSCDHEKLTVCSGHGFRLRREVVELATIDGACQCSEPETHLSRVRTVLALQELLEEHQLVLLPHPRGIKSCYIVFHPEADLRDEALDLLKIRYPDRFT